MPAFLFQNNMQQKEKIMYLQMKRMETKRKMMEDKRIQWPKPGKISILDYTTDVEVAQSDIRPVARRELTRYHLRDALQRVNLILDPNS